MTPLAACCLSLCAVLAGCGSSLPDFARPQTRVVKNTAELLSGDLIRYRELTREDFKGSDPPASFARHRDRLGAATCGVLSPGQNVRIRANELPSGEFDVRAIDLEVAAWMDRSCSWWNKKQTQLPRAYVLEHEQIHFALFEIEARQLAHDGERLSTGLRARGSTREEVMNSYSNALLEEFERASKRVYKRSLEFDEETSNKYRPKVQRRWFERVTTELSALD